jgi:hypothetical protein
LAQWLFASTLPRHPVVTSGANVRFWHKADVTRGPTNVRFRG